MHFLRDSSVSVNIAEVELSAFLQSFPDLAKDFVLVRGKVDDSIRDDDVDRVRLDGSSIDEILDEPLDELSVDSSLVVSLEAKLLSVVLLVLFGDGNLLVCHVDADHSAVLANKFGCDEDVSTGATAQVEECAPLQALRDGIAAAVVPADDFFMDELQCFSGGSIRKSEVCLKKSTLYTDNLYVIIGDPIE